MAERFTPELENKGIKQVEALKAKMAEMMRELEGMGAA